VAVGVTLGRDQPEHERGVVDELVDDEITVADGEVDVGIGGEQIRRERWPGWGPREVGAGGSWSW
jgi:hypothetical protein